MSLGLATCSKGMGESFPAGRGEKEKGWGEGRRGCGYNFHLLRRSVKLSSRNWTGELSRSAHFKTWPLSAVALVCLYYLTVISLHFLQERTAAGNAFFFPSSYLKKKKLLISSVIILQYFCVLYCTFKRLYLIECVHKDLSRPLDILRLQTEVGVAI